MKSLTLAFIAVLAVAGCSLNYDPDVGAIRAGADAPPAPDGGTDGGTVTQFGCSNTDSNPAVAVSFSAHIRPLLVRSPGGCNCHLGRSTAGLDLSSYALLRRGGIVSGPQIVVAGEPCSSILALKLGRTPPFGSRMPFNGPPYYSAEELQLVRDWIAEGAQNN